MADFGAFMRHLAADVFAVDGPRASAGAISSDGKHGSDLTAPGGVPSAKLSHFLFLLGQFAIKVVVLAEELVGEIKQKRLAFQKRPRGKKSGTSSGSNQGGDSATAGAAEADKATTKPKKTATKKAADGKTRKQETKKMKNKKKSKKGEDDESEDDDNDDESEEEAYDEDEGKPANAKNKKNATKASAGKSKTAAAKTKAAAAAAEEKEEPLEGKGEEGGVVDEEEEQRRIEEEMGLNAAQEKPEDEVLDRLQAGGIVAQVSGWVGWVVVEVGGSERHTQRQTDKKLVTERLDESMPLLQSAVV
jgi:hypothetical protein